MPQLRRSVYVFFHRYDEPFLDPLALIQGEAEVRRAPKLLAISVLLGREIEISTDDFELLSAIPSDRWVEAAENPRLRELAEAGLLVSTEDDPRLTELRRRDEQLAAGHWNIYAALFHSLTKWRDLEVAGGEELREIPADALARFVERHGPPPSHFHRRREAAIDLPLVSRDGGLFDALARRKTVRAFDREAPLARDELATVLYETFGCRGYVPVLPSVAALKKTSPSGGSLHPIEAYVLVRSVDGVAPGLYHYGVERHALELLERLDAGEAEELATQFTCGQTYFAGAGALFVLAARFYRSFWKYRKHQRAYGVLLMDAGHLSQTLYLVCAELGLGAFVTAAINGANIEERLGLDPFEEGVLAICGCGRRVEGATELEPDFLPYVPRETRI